jgi:2-C-methyl-D-erythritol 2,4-cyclodiphosphate synthase
VAGVSVAADRGVVATSDGDVLAHAVADAVLGAAALGDLGSFFPSDDARFHGADSMELLRTAVAAAAAAGWRAVSIDATVVAEKVRVAPHRAAMRAALAAALDLEAGVISVKATSTDGLGFIGRDEGLAAVCVAVLGPAG